MSTPGEVLADAVARHRASVEAIAAVAAEIDRERADDAAGSPGAPEGDHAPAPGPGPVT